MDEPTGPQREPRFTAHRQQQEDDPAAEQLLTEVAKGDERAFEQLYDLVSGPVFGLVQRILRDAAQSEEVAQEVLVEVWRTATRYRSDRAGGMTWVLTLAHRRAVDRVRSAQATRERESRVGAEDYRRPFDEVSDAVATRWEQRQVRRCLSTLTELQRESVVLTYYRGYTYPEAAGLLEAPLSTVKTRLRDGLIRLRDCLGVGA
ncbi:ECF RNA polymerase sigma factor SigK [Saccharopolyspora sp. HNM0983]|uniref:ECF RNA polymerase sigma factor SigK n=1 Tax=Saccharopolyspora montiporae TaxID=2781240 RepID=A0A929B9X2_9PSEU|nr:ECF RNA polymerase sigma factor SigK [Saccharopolyspora sp. HNM0983]MBE9373833.1 ECF RNA polymerase sigma factor SigK [Saccharopolyspora sp. HNM0983]